MGKKRPDDITAPALFTTEDVALSSLRPHPRNYQGHPDDELEHIKASITEHGMYRNIVVANDGTILAGHGVSEAARQLGLTTIPVRRMPYGPEDPRALKILVADNEISHLAERDDRALSELLKSLYESADLLGTGYDEMMLANLAMVTRPAAEIADIDAAAEWVGMPEYDGGPGQIQVVVHFATEEDRAEFARRLEIPRSVIEKRKTIWWPEKERDDVRAVRFSVESEGD
jgi:hypothetical protein